MGRLSCLCSHVETASQKIFLGWYANPRCHFGLSSEFLVSIEPTTNQETSLARVSKLVNQQPMDLKQNLSPVWKLTFALVAMVIVGVVARLEFAGLPNVKPVAAMALWVAFCFRSMWLPAIALLIVMGATDLVLGGYDWPIQVSVYGSLLVACWLGSRVRHGLEKSSMKRSLQSTGPRMLVASLIMSTSFYVLTNGMVWACGWYPATFAGLVDCYVAGIPFYRFTLLGDLAFTTSGLVAWQVFGYLTAANRANAQVGIQV